MTSPAPEPGWATDIANAHLERIELGQLRIEVVALRKTLRRAEKSARAWAQKAADEREACLRVCESHGLIGAPGSIDTRALHVNGVVRNIMQGIRNLEWEPRP